MGGRGSDETTLGACRGCGCRLAHDQRYCVRCGARRGPLPRSVAQAIARTREQGAPIALVSNAELADADGAHSDAWLVAPRAAAVAVMGMLGFGVVVGSLVGESAASAGAPTIVAVGPNGSQAATPSNPIGAQNAGGTAGGGGAVQTITVGSTTPVGGSPGGTGAQPGSSSSPTTTPAAPPARGPLPPIKHVFLIVLSNQGYNATFVHDSYLAKTLAAQGEEIPNYYAVAGGQLANEIALMSGQGPTPDTVANCPAYAAIVPGEKGSRGQILGNGCVYPRHTPTLASELVAARLNWKAYVQTTATGEQARLEACRHPGPGTSGASPSLRDPYVAWRNPFLYFRDLTNPRVCDKHNVPLTQFAVDLKKATDVPALSWLIADLCDDGDDTPCAPNAPSGLYPANSFLKSVVPEIKRSPAYKDGGLIAITFDQAPQTGPNADSSSCCGNPNYPNLKTSSPPTTTPTTPTTTPTTTTSATPTPTTTTTTPTSASLGLGTTNPTGGGGQVGLLLISRYVKPGTVDAIDDFNHFSLLGSIERLFGLKRLGYASDPALPLFGTSVWTNYTPG